MRQLLKKWLTAQKHCPVCRAKNPVDKDFCSQCRVNLQSFAEEIAVPSLLPLAEVEPTMDGLQHIVTINAPDFAEQIPFYRVDLNTRDFQLGQSHLVNNQNLSMPKFAIASTETIIKGIHPFPVVGETPLDNLEDKSK